MDKENRNLLWLTLFCMVTLFLFLGDVFFNTRGEPREAIVAYSMLEHGNWILPVNNGDEIAFKPPFFHWCVAAVSALFGTVTEYTSRFPSAFFAALMVIAGYSFFARRRNSEVALLMALVTLTTFEVHRATYACRVDMVLAALTVLALYALYRWTERDMRGIPWLAILLMAGAALTKGPVGALLPCGVTGAYLLLRGKNFFSLLWRFSLIFIAALLPLFLWYALAYTQPHGGDRFLQLIYEENILRFTGQMSYAAHENPWHYNLMTLVAGFVPYTLLAVIALPFCKTPLQHIFSQTALRTTCSLRTYKEMNGLQLFSLLSIVVILVFYTIPSCKRSVYLLPVYPFMAYFFAEWMLWLRQHHARALRIFGHILASLSVVLVVLFLIIRMGILPEQLFTGKHAMENNLFLEALRLRPLAFYHWLIVILPLGATAWFWSRKAQRDASKLPLQLALLIASIFLSLDAVYQPAVLNAKSDKDIALRIAEIAPKGTLYSYRPEWLDANRMHPFTINFYLGDRVIPMDKAEVLPEQGYVIVSGDVIGKFEEVYPQYVTHFVFRSEKRSCDDRTPVYFYQFERKR